MDEKRLEQIRRELEDEGCASYAVEEEREIFRLARLGLWSENHGVPALKQNLQSSRQLLLDLSASQVDYDLVGDIEIDSDEALAALPKTPSTNEAAAEGETP